MGIDILRWAAGVAVGFLIATTVFAQAPAEDLGAGGRSVRKVFDGVRGLVGDRVILDSTIQRALHDAYPDDDLPQDVRVREERMIMFQLAREEIWVQVGKVIGRQNPEEFEARLRGYLDDYLEEQIQAYGSFTRMTQELRESQTSWEAVEAEQRARILRESAQYEALYQRFQNSFSLLATPREMKRFFDEHPEQFQAQESADVAMIAVPTRLADAEDRAKAIIAAWRSDPFVDVEQLAKDHGALATPTRRNIQQSEDDATATYIKDFARDHDEGVVSEPIAVGGNLFVLYLARKISQPQLEFEDPMVQQGIQQMLVNAKRMELETRILRWKVDKVRISPPWLRGL